MIAHDITYVNPAPADWQEIRSRICDEIARHLDFRARRLMERAPHISPRALEWAEEALYEDELRLERLRRVNDPDSWRRLAAGFAPTPLAAADRIRPCRDCGVCYIATDDEDLALPGLCRECEASEIAETREMEVA